VIGLVNEVIAIGFFVIVFLRPPAPGKLSMVGSAKIILIFVIAFVHARRQGPAPETHGLDEEAQALLADEDGR
jgi:hypothetical protein